MYRRFSEGLNNYRLIPETEDVQSLIKNRDKDYYISIYKYNQDHYDHWKKTKSVAGITDVVTDKLVLDFDDKDDVEKARQDTITAISRLASHGIPQEAIQVAFSGQKGFSIEVKTDKIFTVDEFKSITKTLAGDLASYDTVVNDPQRIFRVVGTKHNKTSLYKVPLAVDQVVEWDIDKIKEYASDLNNVDTTIMDNWHQVDLPESITKMKAEEKIPFKEAVFDTSLDINKKPKWLTQAKYALQEGYFSEGDRSNALMMLAATYKNQGFSRDHTYRLLKGTAELQANRYETERFPDDQIWNNITKQVYSPTWNGGQYRKDDPLLIKTAKNLNLQIEKDEDVLVDATKVSTVFKNFAENIDSNTMKLGIPLLDKNVRVTTSMLVGLLGAPSSGKTTISLNFLNYASQNNTKAIFFSLDMGAPLVYQRLIQRHKGITSDDLFKIYKNKETSKIKTIEETISDEYKNVDFCFKSGITPDDIRHIITEKNNNSEQKIKLCVVDYLECLNEKFSDSTANTALIAQKLKDIANDLELTIILLLQPQKHAGDPSDELLSYRNVKGSSSIEQACSIIFSVWRPGFSPKKQENDRFLSMAVLKNRMGSLNQFDFSWEGLRGTIGGLDIEGEEDLKRVRDDKQKEKAAKISEGSF